MSTTPGETLAHPRPAAQPEAPPVPARVRGLVIVVWLVLLAHLAATFVWAAPGYLTGRADGGSASGGTSTGVPSTGVHAALDGYMTPVFAQNWSVFAPAPLHVEYSLRVRGVYTSGPDGDLVPGPWVDATAVEVRALTWHVLPAATERPSRRLAAELYGAYLALPVRGRAVLLVSPVQRSAGSDGAGAGGAGTVGGGSGDPGPWPDLRSSLLDAGGTPDVVDDYLGLDRAAAAYATQVLRASGDLAKPERGPGVPAGSAADLVYVQVSVLRQAVAPQGSGERPAASELPLGARPPVVVPGQDDAAFRTTWDAVRGAADLADRADGGERTP
ncbi:DUF5819 family protein [Promicromonospora sp. NPDC019610]|uniref:DUF5819 family protein n=1 Tax=Promicromonospora sp. NPDC019610 TaxID=3364405 RepID=UPI00379BEBFA